MRKKLSTESIQLIDEALVTLAQTWGELKATWATCNESHELDRAFYRFVDIWLATDHTVDEVTQAHSLQHWQDPELAPLRKAMGEIQVKLAKIDDTALKQRGVEQLQSMLRGFEVV